MTITLPPEIVALLQERMSHAGVTDPAEMIRAALLAQTDPPLDGEEDRDLLDAYDRSEEARQQGRLTPWAMGRVAFLDRGRVDHA